jgi:Delta7-sterol 5-desaturase
MDFVLETCDNLFLDSVYARLLPASVFLSSLTFNDSSFTPLAPTYSAWSQLISLVPHPPLPDDLLSVSSLSLTLKSTSAWPRDYIPRQLLSLSLVTLIGVHLLYFIFSGFSYAFIFNHEMMKHPRFLKNQVRQEIICSLNAFPLMTLLTLPWFEGEVLGYSKLYNNVGDYGWGYLLFSIPL